MVNKEQIDIAKNVQKNINASAANRQASGFADFSQRAGAQTAIDKSIRRQQEKLARRAQSAPGATGPLMLPSSEMLNAAERGIKRIRSVTDQLGEDLDYTNQEVANFINGLKTGANEAVKLPPIFNKVAQSLDVINKNFDSAVAKSKRLAGGAAGGTGSTTPIQGRTAAQKQLAALEIKLINEVAATRAKKDLQSYNTRQKRLRYLAAQEKKAAADRARRAESLALGVGFPLLFGGGAGSVLGSAAGSFAGKDGFGGQIAGGAIGQAIDQYVQGLTALANSLESTQGILTGLEEAGYSVSAATESVIASYQEAGLEAEAYQLAIAEINRVLGPDGASKLSDYRIANEELQGAFEQAKAALDSELLPAITGMIRLMLGLKGAFDTLAESPIFKIVTQGVGGAIQSLPGVQGISQGFGILQQIGAPSGNVAVPESQRLAQEDAKLQKLTQQTEELTKQQEKQWEIDDATRRTNEALEAAIAVERAGTDIKDDNVYKKSKEAIMQAYLNDLIDAGTNAEKRRNAELTKTLALLKLDNRRGRALSGGSSGGGVDKEAQAQKAIAAELTKQFELETKLATIGTTKLDRINIELERLEQRKALKAAELELNTEDARVRAAKLQSLNLETEVLRQQLELQRERAILEEKMTGLKGEQQLAGLERSLNQELQSLTLPTGNKFADEQNQLAIKQQQRYANAIANVNDQIEQQTLLATSSDDDIAKAANQKLELLNRQKQTYETMLPAIAQAEQQQLKFNQTLSLVQGPVNAFVNGLTSGLQGLIDGTKSAEEAFADMLKGMGQALIQTATQMIAQYIAIGIARQFAGIPSAEQQSLVTDTANSNFNALFGGSFSTGGFIGANRVALVGENGPELIRSGPTGTTVTNNEDTKAAMERFSPTNQEAAAGGPMNATINYNGPTLNFNGDDYIPRSEAPQLVAAGAKQGEARAMNRLRQSRSTRQKVGV